MSATGTGDNMLSSTSPHPCRRFSLSEIQSATNNFDDELVVGQGGFGKVYRGCIPSEETSHVVAIKRLDSMSDQGAPEFRAEIEMLSMVRHCHLVSLIGYCDDNKEMILVYEYMPHGTLHDCLHKAKDPLNWVRRLKIAIGAARGLDYLHTGFGTQHGIIHRDIKSSNVLLDENLAARISDFGLSIIGPINQSSSFVDASVKGTFGYLDPEYIYTQKLTRKTDVFAFGVVLFELLSGRFAVDERFGYEQCSLVRWAQKCVKERRLDQLVDSTIRGTIFPKCLRRFAQISDRCLHISLKERPTMAEIVVSLQLLLELQEKFDNSAKSPGIMGFTWKMHNYFVTTAKGNHDHSSINLLKSGEDEMNDLSSTNEDGGHHHEIVVEEPKMFEFEEFKRPELLGERCYGTVYKSWVNTYSPSHHKISRPVAIKRLNRYKRENLEKVELGLALLREFSHPNLLQLIGYCCKGEELLLVYEFMQNGSLEDHLIKGSIARLPLITKVKIALGVARALVFLHETQDEGPSYELGAQNASDSKLERHNILLDEDFTPKLSDYDVTKLVFGHYTSVYDCLDCYYYPGFETLELESNFSGFKVVFAEVLTGKKIRNQLELSKMNDLLVKRGMIRKPDSLDSIAHLCFRICKEEDAESKMLRALK